MTKRLNLKDVAERVGVSEMTASRALRGAPDVSEKTRLRVEAAAQSMGYVPNRIAGSLASRSVNLVAVIVPSLNSYVFPEVLSGISSVLKSTPLKPVVGVSGYDLDEEESVIRELLSWRPSGLVVAGLEHTETTRNMLRSADCPVVEVMDTDGTPVGHCVGISHLEAGREMARQMVARGYRKIGFIGTKMPQDFRALKRLEGFSQALVETGLSLADQELYHGESSIQNGRELTQAMMTRTPEVDAIYYSSDVMAVGGYMHCLANGVSIPSDLALAGFNNLQILEGLPLSLATTDACRREIGQRAAEIIVAETAKNADLGQGWVFEKLQSRVTPGDSM